VISKTEDKLKAALRRACILIKRISGTCPADMFDWEHPSGCNNICDTSEINNCWGLYLMRYGKFKVKETRK